MSMTAAELFEIMKDVPREAWGELDWYCGEFVKKHTYDVVDSDVAEHAFIGSMTAWLPIGWVVGKCEGHDCPDGTDATHMVYDVTDTECVREWVGSSLVAALAAACKEAA